MGCQGSKSAQVDGKLVEKDRKLVKQSWDEFTNGDIVERGLPMFLKVLEDNNAKKLFSFARDEDTQAPEFKDNPQIRSHVKRVFETIGTAVQHIDDFQEIDSSLETLGTTHSNVGVSIKYFRPVGEALMHALKLQLEEKFTKDVQQAWLHFYEAIASRMTRGMDSNIK